MSSVRLALALLCLHACVACMPTASMDPIDTVLESAVASGRITGVIAISANSDGITYQGAFGKRDSLSNTDMTMDTIVQLASMTKAITSVAVMQLVEQDKVGLDRAASDYLPELAKVQVLDGFDAAGKPMLRPPKTAVTVRQLLTHTSGYVYEIWNENAAQYVQLGEVDSVLAGGDGFLAAPLAFDPGESWEYGISTDLLGVLVEAVSGQSLDAYFREYIFGPLAMPDTFFNLPEEKLPRLATVYARSVDGELTAMPHSPAEVIFFSGGGGLVSTANDYIRFLRALLNNGKLDGVRILSADTVELMAQNHIGELEAANTFISVMPDFSNDFDFIPGSVDKFGLGFLINSEPIPGGRSAGSLAWAGIFNTYFWIDREQDICGVLITQILPFYDADVVKLFNRFETAVYSAASAATN